MAAAMVQGMALPYDAAELSQRDPVASLFVGTRLAPAEGVRCPCARTGWRGGARARQATICWGCGPANTPWRALLPGRGTDRCPPIPGSVCLLRRADILAEYPGTILEVSRYGVRVSCGEGGHHHRLPQTSQPRPPVGDVDASEYLFSAVSQGRWIPVGRVERPIREREGGRRG